MHTYHEPLDLVRERSPERPVALVRPGVLAVAARWFQENFKGDVLYAVKANPSPWVIRALAEQGVTSFDDDVWIVSYPKSGNTWTRFLIANLTSGGERVDWTNIDRRVPDIYQGRDSLYQSLPRPRYFKSHEAYRPEYRRVVFIVRDPRDVAVVERDRAWRQSS